MRIVCEQDESLEKAVLARPSGRLDAYGATLFWDAVGNRLTAQTPYLLLDLSEVELLTSAGVGILIRLVTRAQQNGGSLAVFGASARVRTVLEVVNLTTIVNLEEDEDTARARLGELGAG